MLKAPLEESIEKVLEGLGAKLGEREYAEDIKLAAQIDEISTPMPKNRGEKAIWRAAQESDYQHDAEYDNILFMRKCKLEKFKLEYLLWAKDDANIKEAKPNIDDIIARQDYDSEDIALVHEDYDYLFQLSFDKNQKVTIYSPTKLDSYGMHERNLFFFNTQRSCLGDKALS